MDYQNEPIVVTKTPAGVNMRLLGSVHTNTRWVESEFKKVIDSKPPHVDLDLKETTYMSSWAVAILVWLNNELTKAGATLTVTGLQKKVYTTLHYARIDKLLKITPDLIVDP